MDRSPEAERFTKIADLTASLFPVCRGLVYAAPCGVVVRAIAPLIQSKFEDPAVVVLDAGGRWAVSLLSGHEGGANALAIRVANLLGAEPVITTTTEALKSVIVGIGCRRGTPAERIVAAIRERPGGGGSRPRRGPSSRLGGYQGGRGGAARRRGDARRSDPLHPRGGDPRLVAGIFAFGFCGRKGESAGRRRTGGASGGKEDPVHLSEENIQRDHDRPRPGRLFVVGIGPGGQLAMPGMYNHPRPTNASPYLLLTLTALFWAGNAVVARALHHLLPPATMAFWRWVLALLLLFPFVLRPMYEQRALLRANWGAWRCSACWAWAATTRFCTRRCRPRPQPTAC